MKNLELMTLESAFFACPALHTETWVGILLVIATFIMAFGIIYYNRKMLKQSAEYNMKILEQSYKDREHRAIVELVRFCIVPLKEWLKGQKDYQTEELNLQMLLGRGVGNARKSLNQNQFPDGGLLQQEFCSLLEKSKHKEKWDKVVKEYNEICEKLNNKKEKLKENIEEEISEEELKKYWKESKYAGTYDQFKVSLFNNFLSRLEGRLSEWHYVGQAKFDIVKEKVKDHINEIDCLVEEKSRIVSNLEDLVEEVRRKLKNDYNLAFSEQSAAVELYEGEAHFMVDD